MDLIGLLASIFEATTNIDLGRKGFATKGKEQEGRVFYEKGINEAMTAFLEAHASGDSKTIILVEYTFISQELQFCDKTDRDAFGSLTQAIWNFDDSFSCLEAVGDTMGYKVADKTWPHLPKYRIEGFPKDAFHVACMSHKTRIRNIHTALSWNRRDGKSAAQTASCQLVRRTRGVHGKTGKSLGKLGYFIIVWTNFHFQINFI